MALGAVFGACNTAGARTLSCTGAIELACLRLVPANTGLCCKLGVCQHCKTRPALAQARWCSAIAHLPAWTVQGLAALVWHCTRLQLTCAGHALQTELDVCAPDMRLKACSRCAARLQRELNRVTDGVSNRQVLHNSTGEHASTTLKGHLPKMRDAPAWEARAANLPTSQLQPQEPAATKAAAIRALSPSA